MTTSLRVVIDNVALKRFTSKLDPKLSKRALSSALTEIALKVAKNAAEEQIIRGGRTLEARRGGRRGSKMFDSPVDPKRITSRSGRLRASIAGQGFRRGIDDRKLPNEISVGSDVVYAPVHEFGNRFTRARPFLGPALEAIVPQMDDILAKHWERVLE